MTDNPEPENKPENKPEPKPKPKPEPEKPNFSNLFKQATKDVDQLGPLGRIFISVLIILLLFKLTPILDLLYLLIQIVVLPMAFLVALGVFSADTYNVTIGWISQTIEFFANHRKKKVST